MTTKTPEHIKSWDDAWDCFEKNRHKIRDLYQDWERTMVPLLKKMGADVEEDRRRLSARAGKMVERWVGTQYARRLLSELAEEKEEEPLIEQHGGVPVLDTTEGMQVTAPEPRNYRRRDRKGATQL